MLHEFLGSSFFWDVTKNLGKNISTHFRILTILSNGVFYSLVFQHPLRLDPVLPGQPKNNDAEEKGGKNSGWVNWRLANWLEPLQNEAFESWEPKVPPQWLIVH